MSAAYIGTLSRLKSLNSNGSLITELSDRYKQEFGQSSDSQIASWRNSIPVILDALKDSKFNNIQVLIEYKLPIGEERVDIILLGGTESNKKGIIIELKQISDFDFNDGNKELTFFQFNRFCHPAEQVLSYFGRIKHLHSLGTEYEWEPVLVMHNLSIDKKNKFYSSNYDQFEKDVTTFYKENHRELSSFCEEFLLPIKIDLNESEKFDEAPYKQTQGFFNFIKNHFDDVWNNALEILAKDGYSLTLNQKDIVYQIIESAKNKENKVFLINGKPGSGKSLVAIYLLILSLSKEISSVLVARSNRFVPLLRNSLIEKVRAINGIILYVDSSHNNNFIGAENFTESFDIVICDESQRFRKKNINNILKRSPTTVFFYDEGQILNPPEEGFKETFMDVAKEANKPVVQLELESMLRCRGGESYNNWCEELLSLNAEVTLSTSLKDHWSKKYQFKVFSDIKEMLEELKSLNKNNGNNVALVASFTESNGGNGNLLRIGYPLQSKFDLYKNIQINVDWLMQETDYRRFWLEGYSNELTRCASIYGSQGFESDFIGVIWGRDFVIRGNKWAKGEAQVNYDNIDRLGDAARNDLQLYLKLLRNRYRVFLTRGMLGTFVFCEDEQTGEFLKTISE